MLTAAANNAARAVAQTTIDKGNRTEAINNLMALPDNDRDQALALLLDYAQTIHSTIDHLNHPAEQPQSDRKQDDKQ